MEHARLFIQNAVEICGLIVFLVWVIADTISSIEKIMKPIVRPLIERIKGWKPNVGSHVLVSVLILLFVSNGVLLARVHWS
jgi:hypothetical protein